MNNQLPVRQFRHHQERLRRFFCEAESDLGRRSNYSTLVAQLEGASGAGRGPTSELIFDQQRDLDELTQRRDFKAATNARLVTRRLRYAGAPTESILRAVYGPSDCAGLQAWGMLAPLVIDVPAAAKGHRASRSAQPLPAWLVRLSGRIAGVIDPRWQNPLIRTKPTASEKDKALHEEIKREAEAIVLQALTRYDRVGGGK